MRLILCGGGSGEQNTKANQKLSETLLGRFATPADTAKLCLFLLSDDSNFITEEKISINGGRF